MLYIPHSQIPNIVLRYILTFKRLTGKVWDMIAGFITGNLDSFTNNFINTDRASFCKNIKPINQFAYRYFGWVWWHFSEAIWSFWILGTNFWLALPPLFSHYDKKLKWKLSSIWGCFFQRSRKIISFYWSEKNVSSWPNVKIPIFLLD